MQLHPQPEKIAQSAGRIVLLTSGGPMATCVANALARRFGTITVLQEEPEPKWGILRSRARRLGMTAAVGQAICGVFLKLRTRATRSRTGTIMTAYNLDPALPAGIDIRLIGSVNAKSCRDALRELNPDVVAVYGTRIIRRDTLRADVREMRARMRAELSRGSETVFDLKQDPGGIADIEFLAQYWTLHWSERYAELVMFPDVIRQLESLASADLVPQATVDILTRAYRLYRQRVHHLSLESGGGVVPAGEFTAERAAVTEIWRATMEP